MLELSVTYCSYKGDSSWRQKKPAELSEHLTLTHVSPLCKAPIVNQDSGSRISVECIVTSCACALAKKLHLKAKRRQKVFGSVLTDISGWIFEIISKTFPSKIPLRIVFAGHQSKDVTRPREKLIWCLAGGRHMSRIFFSTRFYIEIISMNSFFCLSRFEDCPFPSRIGFKTTGIPKLGERIRITFCCARARLSISDFLGGSGSHNERGAAEWLCIRSTTRDWIQRRKVNTINRGLIRLLIGAFGRIVIGERMESGY